MSASETNAMAKIAADAPSKSGDADEFADLEESRLAAPDGTSLRVFEYGPVDAARVIVVNPIGVPILLSSRLVRELGKRYRAIGWEQRGCRNETGYLPEERNHYSMFLADLVEVVRSKAGRMPHALVGICSGASLALKAVAHRLVEPISLSLVSPAVRFKAGYSPSLFDKSVVPYMRMIAAGDRQLAKSLLDIKAANAAQGLTGSEEERLIEAADRWSLRCLESLQVYARTIRSFADQSLDEELSKIQQKVHIVSAVDDQTVCIHSVRSLARHLAKSQLTEYERGGHFLLFLSAAARIAVAELIARDFRERGLFGQGKASSREGDASSGRGEVSAGHSDASVEESGQIEHQKRSGRGDMQRDVQCVGPDSIALG